MSIDTWDSRTRCKATIQGGSISRRDCMQERIEMIAELLALQQRIEQLVAELKHVYSLLRQTALERDKFEEQLNQEVKQ